MTNPPGSMDETMVRAERLASSVIAFLGADPSAKMCCGRGEQVAYDEPPECCGRPETTLAGLTEFLRNNAALASLPASPKEQEVAPGFLAFAEREAKEARALLAATAKVLGDNHVGLSGPRTWDVVLRLEQCVEYIRGRVAPTPSVVGASTEGK